MSFSIEHPKKVFIYSVSSLINSLESLDKNLGKNNFYHLSQEINPNVSDLLNEKGLFLYD